MAYRGYQIDSLRLIVESNDKFKCIFSFLDFFEDLINESEKDLDNSFMGIYQGAYVNNSHIPRDFYSKLRKYYSTGGLDLKDVVTEFFRAILKKVFLLLNRDVKVDIDCVGSTLETESPFGSVPRTLSVQVVRSFIAARTFVYGFHTGNMVIHLLTKRRLTEKCLKSVTKMTQCSLCQGHDHLKPCAGYCKNTYRDCFAPLMELEQVWDDYLEHMTYLSLKLEGPYNIDAVAGDLPYQISSGIMNFQQANTKLSAKVCRLFVNVVFRQMILCLHVKVAHLDHVMLKFRLSL